MVEKRDLYCSKLRCHTNTISCEARSTRTKKKPCFSSARDVVPVFEHCYGCSYWQGGEFQKPKETSPYIKRLPSSTRPYGFVYDDSILGGLRPDPNELPTLQAMIRLRREGKIYEHIARELNFRKLNTRRGREWEASNIRNIMHRAERNCKRIFKTLDYILSLKS